MVKFTLEHAMKAQGGKQKYSCTLPSISALDWVGWPGRFAPLNDPVPIE